MEDIIFKRVYSSFLDFLIYLAKALNSDELTYVQTFPLLSSRLLFFLFSHLPPENDTVIDDSPTDACDVEDRDTVQPRVRKMPWRRKWQPTPVFCPGKSYGQRSLACYSPWDYKELDMAE